MEPSDRTIVTRSPSRTVRIINLPMLLSAPVEAESSLEADFVRRAALLPGASAVIAQPFRLPVSPKGYRPDYLIAFSCCDVKAVVEIKIASKVARYRTLFDRAAAFLKENGFAFYVVTEKELRFEGTHQRVSRILRYAKSNFPSAECTSLEELLSAYPQGLPIGTLRKRTGASRELVLHLIARRRLTTGPRYLIDDATVATRVSLQQNTAGNPLETGMGITPWQTSGDSSLQPDVDDPRSEI